MIVDFRYHVASLVAVFLALGLGILTGTVIGSDGRLVREQSIMIDAIEAQLGQLRQDRTKLANELTATETELTTYQVALARYLPQLVQNRLNSRHVAVVGVDVQSLQDVEGLLSMAGVSPITVGHIETDEAVTAAGGSRMLEAVRTVASRLLGEESYPEPLQGQLALRWQRPPLSPVDSFVLVADAAGVEFARRLVPVLRQSGRPVALVAEGQKGNARARLIQTTGEQVIWIGSVIGQLELIDRLDGTQARTGGP